jgi:uncharacterized protein (DUF1499 family)
LLKQRLFIGSATIVGLLITAMLVAASIWPVLNDVKTGETPEYPEIQPLYYTADPRRVFDESVSSVKELERWELVKSDVATRKIEATSTTRVFKFVDDVTITVQPVTEFVTRVDVHSRSRVGKGDFGQNARNIEAFYGELEERLGAVRFNPTRPDAAKNTSPSTDKSGDGGKQTSQTAPSPANTAAPPAENTGTATPP